jgi:UDP:flavonoid glycosyltransferase YjiC (YdhE family)
MDIAMAALGTRGDVQPMVALGKGLQAAGHQVTVVAGANFAGWIESQALGFVPALDMEVLMNSPEGRAWSDASDNPLQQLRMMRALMASTGDAMFTSIFAAAAPAELLISSFTAAPFVQAVGEATGKMQVDALLQPYQPTRSGAASLTPIVPRGDSILNRWMGNLAEALIWWVAADTANRLRTTCLQLPPHSRASYAAAARQVPTVFGFSRHVVPPAPDWHADTVVSGYWFLDEAHAWEPSAELAGFLAAGPPPVYIGFGSMSSRNPQATLALILEAVAGAGCRAVVATGWSGARARQLPSSVFVLDHAPHDWLFPQVAAVVHHGGAGTTAAGLRAGKPTLIVPHMSDQPYWGRRVQELGVGCKPLPRHKVTAGALAKGLGEMLADGAMQARAAALGALIRDEDGVALAVAAIERLWARRQAG